MSFFFHDISAVRQEAIKVALKKRKEEEGLQPGLPAPTKRQSFVTRRNTDPSNTVSGKRNSNYTAPPTSFKGIIFWSGFLSGYCLFFVSFRFLALSSKSSLWEIWTIYTVLICFPLMKSVVAYEYSHFFTKCKLRILVNLRALVLMKLNCLRVLLFLIRKPLFIMLN